MNHFLAFGMSLIGCDMAKVKCKVSDCSRPGKKEGFCGWCHRKYKKGLYDFDGTLSYKEAQKKALKEKREREKKKKSKLQIWKSRKKEIKSRLTIASLKVLQSENPESRVTFHCPTLEICITQAECYGRIYLSDKFKKCAKCHIHDEDMEKLEQFLNIEGETNGN